MVPKPYKSIKKYLEPCFMLKHEGLFTDLRVDNSTLPKNMHAYCIRHGDSGDPVTLENMVVVNFYGTFLTYDKFEDLDSGKVDYKEIHFQPTEEYDGDDMYFTV